MKKFIIIIVLLLSSLFYAVSANYTMIGVNDTDGVVLTDNNLQKNLFASTLKNQVETDSVIAGEGIYRRLTTKYYGDDNKLKVNENYPMYINNGEAIKLLSGGESLITTDFDFVIGYSGLVLNDGLAFNTDYTRSDFNDYILVHLSNNLYINTIEYKITTFLHEYTIPQYSVIYFTPEYINFYTLENNDTFIGSSIIDIDEYTTITIGEDTYNYTDFLVSIGEVTIYHDKETEEKEKEKEEETNEQDNGTGNSGNAGEGTGTAEGDYTDKGSHNKKERPSMNESAKAPEAADESPNLPIKPSGPDYVIVTPDWKLPTVTLKGDPIPGVYTLKLLLDIDDPAGVIHGGLVFEILDEDMKVYKRTTITASSGENVIALLNSLVPDRTYYVNGYYKVLDEYGRPYSYKDKDGNVQNSFTILENTQFKTKPATDLGSIVFTKFAADQIYGNQISVDNIGFKKESDMDAVGSLVRVQYRVIEGDDVIGAGVINSKLLNQLTQMKSIAYTYRDGIKSNSEYLFELTCFDQYANELTVENNTILVKTCKQLPKVLLSLERNEYEDGTTVIDDISIYTELDNPDNVQYSKLSAVLSCLDGTVYEYYDPAQGKYTQYVPITPGVAQKVSGLKLEEQYTVTIVCTADNGDGNGLLERELVSKTFSTSTISTLGNLALNVRNVTSELAENQLHERALLSIKLSSSTSTQLKKFVDNLSISLESENGVMLYQFSDEEIDKILNDELIVDTNNIKPYTLTGNTEYKITFASSYDGAGSPITIPVTSSLKQFKTNRTPVNILMPTPETAPGYLNTAMIIQDPDNIIVGKNALVKIFELNGTQRTLMGSFLVEKNTLDYQEFLMSSNSSFSTDGISYNIKQGRRYALVFIAEEANTDKGAKLNYVLDEVEVTINTGTEGKIYLNGLNNFAYSTSHNLPTGYIECEYIENNTKEWIDTGYAYTSEINTTKAKFGTITNSNNGKNVFGYSKNDTNYETLYFRAASTFSTYFGNTYYASQSTSANTIYEVEMTSLGPKSTKNNYAIINGKKTTFTKGVDSTCGVNMAIFTQNDPVKTDYITSRIGAFRMYYFQMYDNDVLVRDMIPCYSIYTHEFGMYDLVTEEFYGNSSGAGRLLGKFLVNSETETGTPADKMLATMNVDMMYPKNWQGSMDFFVDIYNNKKGNKVENTLEFKYVANESDDNVKCYAVYTNGGKTLVEKTVLIYDEESDRYCGTFNYVVDKNDTQDKKALAEQNYRFILYTKLSKDTSSIVPLYECDFTTEAIIYTIANIDEFFAIKTNNRKYVVIDDIYYDQPSARSSTGGNWGSSQFYAQVDFQGFSLNASTYNPLIYYMNKSAKIENMVYRPLAKIRKNTSKGAQGNNNRGAGFFVDNNYGTLSNIYVEYREQQPEDIAIPDNLVVKNATYWSDVSDYADDTNHQYSYLNTQGAIALNNYGTVENFVIDVQTPYNPGYLAGIGVIYNVGTVRNGYLFSSTAVDYKATMNLYRTTSYSSSMETYGYSGLLVGKTATTGNYIGVTENVFVLGNINNYSGVTNTSMGLVSGNDYSVVRNTFGFGTVLTNKVANAGYGPAVGYTVSSINRNVNINYMSDYTYDNAVNYPTGVLALRSKDWVNGVLNVNYSEFKVNEMISVGCYPQVNLSDVMPTQKYLELPGLPEKDDVDVTFSETYKFGTEGLTDKDEIADKEELDAILLSRLTGNVMGDTISDRDTPGFTSDSQIVVAYVQDKTASQVHSLQMADPTIVTNVIYQHMEGTGISAIYMEVYNPTKAYSRYQITGLYFKTYAGSKQTPAFTVNRNLEVSFTKLIDNTNDWKELQTAVDENFRLTTDLDFTGISMKDTFVNGTFVGVLDGNGYTIKNIEYAPDQFKEIYTSANQYYTGLIKQVNGKVKNLTLDNVNFEGGGYCGALTGYASGALFTDVYVTNSYVAGQNKTGGLIGYATYCDFDNCGVSNTKVVSVGGEYSNYTNAAYIATGGFVGFLDTANNINRCFASEVYVEAFTHDIDGSGCGGLIGTLLNGGNYLGGVYSTGVVNTNAFGEGGLIGVSYNATTISSAYADVDVNSYYQNASALIGVEYNTNVSNTLLAFGNVQSAIILPDDNDVDKSNTAFSMTSNDVAVSGIYYENSYLRSNDTIARDASKSFSASLINDVAIYDYLNDNEFVIDENASKGVLPKLLNTKGEILPNQNDVHIKGYGDVQVSVNDSFEDRIVINIVHDPTLLIEDVYLDYTYENNTGVNTLTNHKAMSVPYDKSVVQNGTQFVITGINDITNIRSFYDYYKVTAVKVKTNEGSYIQRVNYRLNNITPKYRTVKSANDWSNYVAGTIAENFYISGDIDFSEYTLNYYDETITNLVINRLIGTKGNETNYLDKKNNPAAEPYYKIENISYESYNQYAQPHGMIYNFNASFIRTILSQMENLTFDNNYVGRPGMGGLISHVQYSVKNINFTNNSISNMSTNNACWGSGLIGYSSARLENIYMDNNDVNLRTQAAGVLVGLSRNAIYNTGIKNVYANNCHITKNVGYAGTAVISGYVNGNLGFRSARMYIDNVTVENSSSYCTGGGYGTIVAGNIYGTGSAYLTISNSSINNCNVYCNSLYVGGFYGYNQMNSRFLVTNCYAYNTIVKGGSYTGGIGGVWAGNSKNNTVENCTISALGNVSYCGGIFGGMCYNYTESNRGQKAAISTYADDDEINYDGYVINTKVYGNSYVGGYTGYNDANSSNYFIVNCEVRGNNYVGGLAGTSNSQLTNGYVKNTIITEYANSAEASAYGVYWNATHSYFGGLLGINTGGARIFSCLIENSFVGGYNVTRVGGIVGELESSGNDVRLQSSSCENCVVVGLNDVGGIAGTTYSQSGSASSDVKPAIMNVYSNAYLYGQAEVGGLIGRAAAYKNTEDNIYYGGVSMENCYFTGVINSDTTASALIAKITGIMEKTNYFFRNVASMPKYIKAQEIYPFFIDYHNADQVFTLEMLKEDASKMQVSLYTDTKLYYTDENGDIVDEATMNLLLQSDLYKELVGDTKEEVYQNYVTSVAGDPFVAAYTSESDIRDNFYTYAVLDTLTDVSYGTKYIGMTDFSTEYMPRYYYPATSAASKTESNIAFNINNYHSMTNPFTGVAHKLVSVEQGIYVPGSTKYNEEVSTTMNIYDMYANGDLSASGLGIYIDFEKRDTDAELESIFRNIPSEYEQVEFLQSSGTQWIDTGYVPNVNTEVEVKWMSTSTAGSQQIVGSKWDKNAMNIRIESEYYKYYGKDAQHFSIKPNTTKADVIHYGAYGDQFSINNQGYQWKWVKYAKGNAQPYPSDFIGKSVVETRYFNDYQLGTAMNMANNYSATATTYIYLEEPLNKSFRFYTDEAGTLTVNGVSVGAWSTRTWTTIPVSFQQGWNEIIICYTEGTENDGWSTDPLIINVPEAIMRTADKPNQPVNNRVTTDTLANATNSLTLFATNGGSNPAYGRLYAFKIWENNVIKHDFVPARHKVDNVIGLYDIVTGDFLTNDGSDDFTYGMAVEKSYVIDKNIHFYPADVDVLNIEIDNSLLNAVNVSNAKISLKKVGYSLFTDIPVNKENRTISIKYDFNSTLELTLEYTADGLQHTVVKDNFIVNGRSPYSNHMSLYGGNIYYTDGNSLFKNATTLSTSITPVNIYDDEVMDSNGKIYYLSDITSSKSTFGGILKLDTPIAIASFNYNDKPVLTYGKYSIIDGNISDEYMLFKKNNNVIAIKGKNDPAINGVYADYADGLSTILMLSDDGKVYSIGTRSILTKMNNFTNGGIKAITTNLSTNVSATNTYIGFEYDNGRIAIFNLDDLSAPIKDTNPVMKAAPPKLMTFLRSSFNTMFNFSEDIEEEHSSEAQDAYQVIELLDDLDVSLDDVVSFAALDEENVESLNNAVETNDFKMVKNKMSLTLNLHKNDENEGVDHSLDEVIDGHNESELIEEFHQDINEDIEINIEGEIKEETGLITDQSITAKHDYLAVYDKEENKFEIVDAEKLVEDPENIESEDSRIVDKATLKSLYNSFSEKEDNTTKRGLILYSIIAALILVLVVSIASVLKKVNNH